jgi:hypothetical protein
VEEMQRLIKEWQPDQTVREYISSSTYALGHDLIERRKKKPPSTDEKYPTPAESNTGQAPTGVRQKPGAKKEQQAKQKMLVIPTITPTESSMSITEAYNMLTAALVVNNKWPKFNKIDLNLVTFQLKKIHEAFGKSEIKFTKSIESDARLVVGQKLHALTIARLLQLRKLCPVTDEFRRVNEFFGVGLKDYTETISSADSAQ